jgi:2-polyprenyl-3-methyl-5-hydroxy-6-metoxy-1,4-benzoquinol methylase
MKSEADLQRQSYAKGFNVSLAKYRTATIRRHCVGRRCLDVGCGEGDITLKLSDLFDEVLGIDITSEYLKVAESRNSHANVSFKLVDFDTFDTDLQFDTIIAVDLLEHVADVNAVLLKIKRLLGRNGVFLCIVPNAKSLHRRIGKTMGLIRTYDELGKYDLDVGHRRYFDSRMLIDAIHTSGLKPAVTEGILLKPFPNAQMEGISEIYWDALYEVGHELPDYCAELFVAAKRMENA